MAGNAFRRGAFATDMNVRLTEITHQALVRIEIYLLVAEEDDAVSDDGVMYFLNLPISQRPGEIDIADLGADMRRTGRDGNGVVTHGAILFSGINKKKSMTKSQSGPTGGNGS